LQTGGVFEATQTNKKNKNKNSYIQQPFCPLAFSPLLGPAKQVAVCEARLPVSVLAQYRRAIAAQRRSGKVCAWSVM